MANRLPGKELVTTRPSEVHEVRIERPRLRTCHPIPHDDSSLPQNHYSGMYESKALLCPPNVPVALRQGKGHFRSQPQPQPQPQARGSAGYPRLTMQYSVPGLFPGSQPTSNSHLRRTVASPKNAHFWMLANDSWPATASHDRGGASRQLVLFSSRQLRCLLLFTLPRVDHFCYVDVNSNPREQKPVLRFVFALCWLDRISGILVEATKHARCPL